MALIDVRGLNLYYGSFQALFNVRMSIQARQITAIIGSSGCGKSTLLRCINRMNDLIEDVRITGSITVDGEEIFRPRINLVLVAQESGHGVPTAESVSPERYLRISRSAPGCITWRRARSLPALWKRACGQ